MAVNTIPELNLPLFINASVARIHQLYQCRITIDTLHTHTLIKNFLTEAFTDAIRYEKHLLIKALSLATGTHVDVAYESNLLLKDTELENYIIEFLTFTQKGKQLALLETYTKKP